MSWWQGCGTSIRMPNMYCLRIHLPERLYADCTFANLEGTNIVAAKSGGTLNLVNCTFAQNTITPIPDHLNSATNPHAALEINGNDICRAVLTAFRDPHWTEHYTAVRAEKCTFKDNNASYVFCASSPETDDHDIEEGGFHPFYSDQTMAVWNYEGTKSFEDDSKDLEEVPDDAGFLTATDPHFLAIQQVKIENFCLMYLE